MHVLVVMGTRPEAIKLAPVVHALRGKSGIKVTVCSTGQHREMVAQVLPVFEVEPGIDLDLMLPGQDLFDLTAKSMGGLRAVIGGMNPDLVVVQGDTTSTMGGALAAYYLKTPVAHVEAGLRTFDKYQPFPEEINRAIIDAISDLCFAPTELARGNLLGSGVAPERAFVTGNTVVDALRFATGALDARPELADLPLTLEPGKRLILVTGHRRESFGAGFEAICEAIRDIATHNADVQVVYPVHLNPNVTESVHRVLDEVENVCLIAPQPYLPFVHLMRSAYLVLTDSGGVQEEAPSFGVPVLVMRNTTERPEGVEVGVAKLVGVERASIVGAAQALLDDAAAHEAMAAPANPYGDGHAAERIADIGAAWGERGNVA